MSYNQQLHEILRAYRKSGEAWPTTAKTIAAWAVRTRRWKPDPTSVIGQCADDLSRAMREEYITDPQNRRIRANHAARIRNEIGTQQTLWADIRTASPEHMSVAFQQRRRGIVGDCRQLKTDVDSYNENNHHEAHFQLALDFTFDVEEMELSEV